MQHELDKNLSKFVSTLSLDFEMVMPVLEYARDLVLEEIPPLVYHADDSEHLQVDQTVPDPLAEVVGPIDNPQVPPECLPLLTIGMRVVIVETEPHHAHFRCRVGTLRRYDEQRGLWWVQFPQSKNRCWDGAYLHSKNLLPFKDEKAFQLYRSHLQAKRVSQVQQECHVPARWEDLVKDEAQQVSWKLFDASEEEQMRFAVAASEESFRDKQKLMQATNDSEKVTHTSAKEGFKKEEQLTQAIGESDKMAEVQHTCRDKKVFELHKSRNNQTRRSSHNSFAATEEEQLIFALLASEETFRNEEKLMQATKEYEFFNEEERSMQAIDESPRMTAQEVSKSAKTPKLKEDFFKEEQQLMTEVAFVEQSIQGINEFAKRTEVQEDYHVLDELDDLNMDEWTVVTD